MSKRHFLLLAIILFASFLVRFYRIDNPIADWHAWRQADTSAVSRNFVQDRFDLFHPRFDDLSNVPSGIENPQGYRFVEFPIYNAVQAGLYNIFGAMTLEMWGRFVSIVASLGSIAFLFLLVQKYAGLTPAFFAAGFFGLLPFNVYYSRTILPDPSMVMAILGGIYFFDRWVRSNVMTFFALAIIFTASAFLLKPFALFFTLPMIYLAFRKWGIGFVRKPQLWIFAIVTVLPLVFWRIWMQQYEEGIPNSGWLLNADNIRFKGAFFYWLFGDRIGRLILGYWGIALLALGLIRKSAKDEGLFFYAFLASSLLYMIVIASGNVQHDYYQMLILPTLAIFLGKGVDFLLLAPKELFHRVICYVLLVTCTVFMFAFSWYHIRDYYNTNNPSIVVAGSAVDQLTPKDAKVIAPMEGDTSFLYHTKRKGWASFVKPIEEMIVMGADYLVLTNPSPNDFTGFGGTYKIVSATKEYILYDLHKKP